MWTYSGVRPLFDDGASKAQEATRDYVLRSEGGEGKAPLLNIFGGKITSYRHVAQEVVDLLAERVPALAGKRAAAVSFRPGVAVQQWAVAAMGPARRQKVPGILQAGLPHRGRT